jgi:arylsulfatase A-like enzyme
MRTQANRVIQSRNTPRLARRAGHLGPIDVLLLSAWCGLAAGWLEVAARVFCRAIDPDRRLYLMSRHFIWLTPVANLVLFLGVGLLLAGVTRLLPRQGDWLSRRLLCAMAVLPMLMRTAPVVFPQAWFIFALGLSSQLVPWLQVRPTNLRPWFLWSFPGLVGLVVVLAGSLFGLDWVKHRREASRALPGPGAPNVLFIVLDTVRADRLSLYGYRRPTTPTLERLARNGIRFDRARATAPWTLPSHASCFTGRWPRELNVRWLTPLRTSVPTLAEYLGSRGYATAGLVANTTYCSYDTGLDRGFTDYEDYMLEKLGPLRTAVLVEGFATSLFELSVRNESSPLDSLREFVEGWFYSGTRRDAGSINRGFLDWLARRPQPARPFFVFLNYIDAHTPYKLPDGVPHRFGHAPQSRDEVRVVYDGWPLLDKLTVPRHYLNMARDSYDSCLAYLDGQLSLLFDELQRHDLLDDTLVVIASDHGEGLGEHNLFDHGESLYDTELRVPLLIVPPSTSRAVGVVRDVVSLRDLPATIVDLAGLSAGSPFPGQSLAKLWCDPSRGAATTSPAISELSGPSPRNCNHGRSPADRGAMISLAEEDFVYIRNEGDQVEELYNTHDDPGELINLANSQAFKPILERFRTRVARFKQSTR